MFDVIDFLESMGQDAQLRYASSEHVVATLAAQPIDSKLRDAILAKDALGLGALLGQDSFCCYINPAKEDEAGGDSSEKDKAKKKPAQRPKK
ncbi:hypothetical protein [Rhodanobacter sp. C05]|uniref:hypothetical protein n=1 Tax=Rhodanobacter sp. C05 TaxID=1945855 RepID=UPI0009866172|nr:hypothetical protein [Rhodanobacter sp. C05]OOG38135.1 hypothetical protein B0E51_14885 [Rhodanobacter sp. C05]